MKRMTDQELLQKHLKGGYPYNDPGNLHYTGRLAYLDGRTKDAKEYNRRGDRLAKLLPSRG